MLVRERFPIVAGRLAQGPTRPKQSNHSEAEVKATLRPVLQEHFVVREEITGTYFQDTKVRLDFWCFPKPKTIEQGWPAEYFGIEAKGYGDGDQHTKTAARLVSQAIIYRLSEFPTDGSGRAYPHFVLIYPSLDLVFESASSDPVIRAFDEGIRFGLAKEAAMFRVGELVLTGNGFEVYFHGINRWFHSRWGRDRADCLGKEDNHASR